MLKVLDLFSGIGGFSYAAERIVGGFETVGFCEIDPFCQKVLKKNFPNVPIYTDIKELEQNAVRFRGYVDVICGGFPCQVFSNAGKKEGHEDKKGRYLWPEMASIIKQVLPRFVIGENVRGFVNMPMGLPRSVNDLESIGYRVASFVIPSAYALGLPHRRERCWIIAELVGNSKHDGQSAKSQLWSDDETSNEWGKEKQKATREFEGANRSSNGASISGSKCKSEQSAVQKENRTRSDVADTNSGMRRGGRAISESRENKKGRLHSKKEKQNSNDLWSKTVGCNPMGRETKDVSNSNDNGQQRGCIETCNEASTRQDTQSEWRTNTKDVKRQSNDGLDSGEPKVDGDLSGSPDRGTTISAETRGVCELSENTDNDQGISIKDKYQENNDRTLVSQGQKGFQLSEHRGLASDQTISENNTIRSGDDNNSNERMENRGSEVVADTESKRLQPLENRAKIVQSSQKQRILCRSSNAERIRQSETVANSNGIRQQRSWETIEPSNTKKDKIRETSRSDNASKRQGSGRKSFIKMGYLADGISQRLAYDYTIEPKDLPRVVKGEEKRAEKLKALGNSIIPQCVAVFFQAIKDTYEDQKDAG